ncbi:MAG: hypothetical protein AAB837_00290 [Patescibacteria group bacterium]
MQDVLIQIAWIVSVLAIIFLCLKAFSQGKIIKKLEKEIEVKKKYIESLEERKEVSIRLIQTQQIRALEEENQELRRSKSVLRGF